MAEPTKPATDETGATRRPPTVVIRSEAHARILEHAGADATTEVCGILIGRAEKSADGWTCTIVDAIEGRFARQEAVSVTFTHETWDYVHRVLDERKDDLSIVGWYHTHPGFGIFYSEHDMFVQASFFAEPWQIGLVVDPASGDEGIFANAGAAHPQPVESFTVRSDDGDERIECTYVDEPVRESAGDDAGIDGLRKGIERLALAVSEQDRRIAQTQILAVAAAGLCAVVIGRAVINVIWPRPPRFPVIKLPMPPPGSAPSFGWPTLEGAAGETPEVSAPPEDEPAGLVEPADSVEPEAVEPVVQDQEPRTP